MMLLTNDCNSLAISTASSWEHSSSTCSSGIARTGLTGLTWNTTLVKWTPPSRAAIKHRVKTNTQASRRVTLAQILEKTNRYSWPDQNQQAKASTTLLNPTCWGLQLINSIFSINNLLETHHTSMELFHPSQIVLCKLRQFNIMVTICSLLRP